jgi:hypothetical protein
MTSPRWSEGGGHAHVREEGAWVRAPESEQDRARRWNQRRPMESGGGWQIEVAMERAASTSSERASTGQLRGDLRVLGGKRKDTDGDI